MIKSHIDWNMIISVSGKNKPCGLVFYYIGDLGGSRTRVAGMKTRGTNRYTTRP